MNEPWPLEELHEKWERQDYRSSFDHAPPPQDQCIECGTFVDTLYRGVCGPECEALHLLPEWEDRT